MDEARWYRLRILQQKMTDYELSHRERAEAVTEYEALLKKR